MNLQNLKEHHEELLSFMENNGYSSTYIRRFREEINRILAKADSYDWQSYRDVYLDYFSPLSTQGIANIVTKICRIAGVRQNPGDRKGTHIFRHNLASSMLEKRCTTAHSHTDSRTYSSRFP